MGPAFSLLGVPVTLRPTAVVTGITSALVVAAIARERRALLALSGGALWYAADCFHVMGHILSSRAVGAPMDAIDVGLYPKSVYVDHNVTPQQHIGRSVGGVAASLLGAVALTALARAAGEGRAKELLTIAAAQHGLLFALSMLPTPLVDGGVIYANLAKLR